MLVAGGSHIRQIRSGHWKALHVHSLPITLETSHFPLKIKNRASVNWPCPCSAARFESARQKQAPYFHFPISYALLRVSSEGLRLAVGLLLPPFQSSFRCLHTRFFLCYVSWNVYLFFPLINIYWLLTMYLAPWIQQCEISNPSFFLEFKL